jgi:AcrR family transcriptional regulator
MTVDSRSAIRDAARQLFADRSFAETTIREIAERATVSPALVIKHFRSKGELYLEVGPSTERLVDLDLPREALGQALVKQIFDRRDRGATEPWIDNLVAIQQSPTPNETRIAVHDRMVSHIAALIGDTSSTLEHAQAVVSTLIGIAHAVRELDLFAGDQTELVGAISMLSAAVQAFIDSA